MGKPIADARCGSAVVPAPEMVLKTQSEGRWKASRRIGGASIGENRVDYLIHLVGDVLAEFSSSSRVARWLLIALTLGLVLVTWILWETG
jgi:hypothetical protein